MITLTRKSSYIMIRENVFSLSFKYVPELLTNKRLNFLFNTSNSRIDQRTRALHMHLNSSECKKNRSRGSFFSYKKTHLSVFVHLRTRYNNYHVIVGGNGLLSYMFGLPKHRKDAMSILLRRGSWEAEARPKRY